jgi:Holliday junction resolvase-like predicted endonuclease
MNVGEQLVSSYLRYVRGCEFTQTNLYTVEAHGEIDVIGINLRKKKVYICEVAIHLTTGLKYVKDKRSNNIQKLTDKFSRDIEYATKYFSEYERHFMLWSPIVKDSQGRAQYNQLGHLIAVKANIKEKYGVELECIINEAFHSCLKELRRFAAAQTSELQCPLLRLLQIEELLGVHVMKITTNKRLQAACEMHTPEA